MNCHEARDFCSTLVDDALSADERTVLQEHLDGCAECRRELDRLRQTVALLGGMAPARAPAGFVDRVLAAARPEPWHRRALRALSLPFRVRLPLEAAALLLVGGLAVYVFQHSPELQQAARNESPPAAPAPAQAPPVDPRAMADKPASAAAPTGAASAPAPATTAPVFTSGARQSTVPRSAETTVPPARSAPAAPAQQPSPVVGAKESQSAGRAADVHQGGAGEVGKTRNAEPSEEDRRRAASGSGEREQKKIGARADQSRLATSDSAQPASPAPAAPPAGEGARKAGAPPTVAPPATAPPAAAPPATPPSAAAPPGGSVAETPPPASSRDDPAARSMVRPKAAEPALRSRQEIAASAPAPQGGAHVAAVLSAGDRDAALQGLTALVVRAQGRELARRPEADGTVVDLLIPRAAYAEFAQGLRRLGQVVVPFQASTLPDEVRVSVRVRP